MHHFIVGLLTQYQTHTLQTTATQSQAHDINVIKKIDYLTQKIKTVAIEKN